MVGFDPNKDHLLDPQQKPGRGLQCGGCGRQIYYGEIFYELITIAAEITICHDCYTALGRSRDVFGEECYV